MTEEESSTLVAEPKVNVRKSSKQKQDRRPKQQPRYQVILWNDDDHSYEYVALMMRQIFGYPFTKGFQIAKAVDSLGRCTCLTTTKEHAELKRDQIHAFGRDFLIERCKGSMSATIEAVE